MQWWSWVIVGAILLGAELSFVDAQFYLVFVGVAAIAVGLLSGGGIITSEWLQWALFAALAIISMAFFRRRIYAKLRPNLSHMKIGPAGELVTVPSDLPPGESCRVEFRGSSWMAVNAGADVIVAGARARIERVDGLNLVLHNVS
jgi:membrane protein implicated in regulation of membrane protease activity